MAEYVRQMPSASSDLARRPAISERFHIDFPLLFLLMGLTIFGLVVLYSASGQRLGAVVRQAQYFVIAYVVMLAAAQVSVQRYRRWAPFIYLGGLALLVGVLLFGVGAKGAQRWLSIGGFRFQPSELMKLAMPLMLAWYLASRILPPRLINILVALVLVGVPAALIVRQPDLGTALLVSVSGLIVLFMAGIRWRFIFGAGVLAVISAWPAWVYLLHDYQRQRILTLLSPERDKLGTGWNIIQSKTAIGSGGWSGKGWLNGTQSQLDFLPESHTDFIIAVLAEEFGLRGVILLLAIYLLIFARGFWIGMHAQDSFSRLVAAALTLTFFIYVFVNMGMVSGLLPVVGVPLPLVSAGGTSIVTLMAGFGILMAISTERRLVVQ
ncbi:MAG: rod shape-determining protein RodA [Halieaceae bacterium]|nr:rod shape-determining protein RodA [Halieaceae bacterium]